MSLRELYVAKPDQRLPHNSKAAYREIASGLRFDVLGVAPEEQLAGLNEDPGTLADQKWLAIGWKLPEDEASPCWRRRAGKGKLRSKPTPHSDLLAFDASLESRGGGQTLARSWLAFSLATHCLH